jgi:hypothetical protein
LIGFALAHPAQAPLDHLERLERFAYHCME